MRESPSGACDGSSGLVKLAVVHSKYEIETTYSPSPSFPLLQRHSVASPARPWAYLRSLHR